MDAIHGMGDILVLVMLHTRVRPTYIQVLQVVFVSWIELRLIYSHVVVGKIEPNELYIIADRSLIASSDNEYQNAIWLPYVVSNEV
jgi:hypothetical protein